MGWKAKLPALGALAGLAVALLVLGLVLGLLAAVAGVVVAAAVAVGVSLHRAVKQCPPRLTRDRAGRIALRLGFLVASAVALTVVCRQGASLFRVGLVFTVYVAAATLWVRGQHQAYVDAAVQGDPGLRPWTVSYWVSVPGVVAGLAVAVVGVWQDVSSGLVCGVLLTYFGLGYVLMRFRLGSDGGARRRLIVAAVVLGISAVALAIGLLALIHHTWALGFLAAGLLLPPIALSLLAELAIRWSQLRGHGLWVAVGAAAALVAFIVDTGIAMARADPAWALGGFVALALLMLAIVSSTQADIAAVIGAVALMGVTALSEDKPPALTPQKGQTRVLVALGDSYMSGEGAGIYYSEEVDAEHAVHRNHCNRAPTAWAAVAGRTHRLFDSVAFLACSGARTFNVEHAVPPSQHAPAPTPTPQYNEPHTQLDEVDELNLRLGEKLDPSLVVVSLGGNDAGFSTIGEMCLAPGNCGVKRSLWLDNLPTVREALEKTFGEIRAEFPQAPVLVVPYPAPLYTDAKGNPRKCGQVALSVDDMRFINTFLRRLNKTVKAAAGARQFYFLGAMEQSLADAHLQLCDPHNDKRPGINFIGLRSVGGIAAQRFNPKNWYHNSLHPNERGHAAMLQAFEQWRADNPDPPRDAPRVGGDGDKGRSGGAVTNPPCDIVEDDQSTTQHCREAGAEWAKGQVRNALVRHFWGLQILLAALAAWVMGVALFGWWKPWWPDRPGPPPSE